LCVFRSTRGACAACRTRTDSARPPSPAVNVPPLPGRGCTPASAAAPKLAELQCASWPTITSSPGGGAA
jgi:hypothetical protein